MNADDFASLLRGARRVAGMSQQMLAERAGLSVDAVAALERRRRRPRAATIGALADALGLSGADRERLVGAAVVSGTDGIEPGARMRDREQATLNGTAGAMQARPRPVPEELPHDVVGLVGRERELTELASRVDPDGPRDPGSVPIVAITGVAGVGKTALTVHFAHRVASRFPDGQLYLDLRGFDPDRPPVPSGEALARVLPALGIEPAAIPDDVDARTALYRSVVARQRLLVVLDNAASANQVRPLLPGSPTSVVLITSRNRLAELVATDGADHLEVDPLDGTSAAALVASVARGVTLHPQQARHIAQLCGHLPLALRIAAARLVVGSHRVAELVEALTDARRWRTLDLGPHSVSVRAAFDLSYRALSAPAQQLFRRLSLVPGRDFLADVTDVLVPGLGHDAVDELMAANLVEHHPTDRYRMHDLLRSYALECLQLDERTGARESAQSRLLTWYENRSAAASAALPVRVPGSRPANGHGPGFDDSTAALAWLEAERDGLLGAIRDGMASGHAATAARLSQNLHAYFRIRRQTADWLATASVGIEAARVAGDRDIELVLLGSLGEACRAASRFEDALACYEEALVLCRAIGRWDVEASLLNGLGVAHHQLGQFGPATARYHASYLAHRRQGNDQGRAASLNNIGLALRDRGLLIEARCSVRRSLNTALHLGSPYPEAVALTNLGVIEHELGASDVAEELLHRAQSLNERLRSQYGEATLLQTCATLALDTGRPDQAQVKAMRALELSRDIGERVVEADALSLLGRIHCGLGNLDSAAVLHKDAIDVATRHNYRRGTIVALTDCVETDLLLGNTEQAFTHATAAHELATRWGYRLLGATALTALGTVQLKTGEVRAALESARAALQIHRVAGHRWGVARTARLAGACQQRLGRPRIAAAYQRLARPSD